MATRTTAWHADFRLGTTTFAEVVPDTCDVIYNTLQPTEMPDLSEEHWSEVAEGFAQRWKFPNCIGAVDGKHCHHTEATTYKFRVVQLQGVIFYESHGYG